MKPVIIDGVIYETQTIHDWRIDWENGQYKRRKQLSRSRATLPDTRRRLLLRARGQCEICAFGFTRVLNIHHIYPVSLGGSALDSNLIAICPNCHSIIHKFSRSPVVSPKRHEQLMEVGYTSEAADRLLLVASLNAKVDLEQGVIIPHDNNPNPMPCFIVDAPNADPVRVARYWEVIEARERKAKIAWSNSHIERGRRYIESQKEKALCQQL